MEENEFGLSIKIAGIGYFDKRFTKGLHGVKSIAGKAFHKPFVTTVCVYSPKGVAHLYLKKTANGVVREERE